MLCSEGSAKIKVHTHEHLLMDNELVILLPGQLVSIYETSQDFKINAFSVSQSLFNDVLSGIHRFSPHFFIYMRTHFHYKLMESESINFENYYNLVCSKAKSASNLPPGICDSCITHSLSGPVQYIQDQFPSLYSNNGCA